MIGKWHSDLHSSCCCGGCSCGGGVAVWSWDEAPFVFVWGEITAVRRNRAMWSLKQRQKNLHVSGEMTSVPPEATEE